MMEQDFSQLKQALSVATITELRSCLNGQLDRFELIGNIVVQRLKDRADDTGNRLESLSTDEFQRLAKTTLTIVAAREG